MDRTLAPIPFPAIGAALLTVALFMLAAAVPAAAGVTVEAPERVGEGEPFLVRVFSETPLVSVTVRFLGRELRPVVRKAEGGMEAWVLLGLGMHERQPGSEFELAVAAVTPGGTERLSRTIRRTPKKYAEQRLDVNRKYVHLSEEELARHRREQQLVREAYARVSTGRAFVLPLQKPLEGRTSSTFGLRRYFNGEARKPHSGWDIAAPGGTEVRSCADGLVVLAGDHFFAGRSVYIDHGHGLLSMYFHLSEIKVAQGQAVRRGEVIGLVGQSGRVTGPHLHWGTAVLGQLVDPTLLVAEPDRLSGASSPEGEQP